MHYTFSALQFLEQLGLFAFLVDWYFLKFHPMMIIRSTIAQFWYKF